MGILGRPRRRKNGAVETAQRAVRQTAGVAIERTPVSHRGEWKGIAHAETNKTVCGTGLVELKP
jgi:hypothetical protein